MRPNGCSTCLRQKRLTCQSGPSVVLVQGWWDAGASDGTIQRYAALGSPLIAMSEPVPASRIQCQPSHQRRFGIDRKRHTGFVRVFGPKIGLASECNNNVSITRSKTDKVRWDKRTRLMFVCVRPSRSLSRAGIRRLFLEFGARFG